MLILQSFEAAISTNKHQWQS